MNKDVQPEHTELILREMCRRVDVDYDALDFKDNWFQDYEWTEKEQEDFRVWLGKFLVKHKYATNRKYRGMNHGYYQAGKIVFNYGWRIKQ